MRLFCYLVDKYPSRWWCFYNDRYSVKGKLIGSVFAADYESCSRYINVSAIFITLTRKEKKVD